jgi:DNA sulfur modification protein DndC
MTETLIGIESKNTVEQFIDAVEILTQEIQDLYLQEECPLIIGWSGGKDSTSVLQIIWNSIAALPVEQRTKTIHVITNDTLVENPIISTWVKRSLEKMQLAAKEQKMPIETHLTYPAIQDTFWVCLIGKGYPTPRQRFRWCTDRLKIQPADSFIQEVLKTNREAILVLGTRKTESIQRSMNMAKHRKRRVRDRLNTNPRRPDCLVYSPIEDWRTDEVWMYLMQWENPWGLDNKELLAMY